MYDDNTILNKNHTNKLKSKQRKYKIYTLQMEMIQFKWKTIQHKWKLHYMNWNNQILQHLKLEHVEADFDKRVAFLVPFYVSVKNKTC